MRLTCKDDFGEGAWADKDYCLDMKAVCKKFKSCSRCPVAKLLDRLCEYEETGFEPEDILKMYRVAIFNTAEITDRLVLKEKENES